MLQPKLCFEVEGRIAGLQTGNFRSGSRSLFPESGVGRAHNIAMSTLPGFVLPGEVSASRRYWEEDIIEPEVEVSPEGTIRVPETAGLGFAVRRDLVDRLTVRCEEWKLELAVGF